MGILGPVYSIYFEKISGSIREVGILIGIYWIIVGLLEVPFGILSDKIGKKKIFTLGGALVSFSIFLYPLIYNLHQILLAQIIGALGYSMQMPAFYALLADATKKKKRCLEIGFIDASGNIFYGLASMFSGLLISIFGFSLIFIFASVLHFTSSVVVGKAMKEFL